MKVQSTTATKTVLTGDLTIAPALRVVLALCVLASSAGCSDGGDGGNATPEPPVNDAVYAVGFRIDTPDGGAAALAVTPSLETTLSAEDAILFPGTALGGFYGPFDGAIFVGDSEQLTVRRFELNATGALEETGTVSFANTGLRSFPLAAHFVSTEKAYLIDPVDLRILTWNPTEMVLTGEISLATLARPSQDVFIEHAFPWGEGRMIAAVAWADYNSFTLYPRAGALIVDTELDEVITVAEIGDCLQTQDAAISPDGDFYTVCDPFNVAFRGAGTPDVPTGCLVRIPAGGTEFDPGFFLELDTVVGDRASGLVTIGNDGKAFTLALYPERLEGTDPNDIYAPFAVEAWRLWEFDLETGASSREVASVPFTLGYYTDFNVDGRVIVTQRDRGREGTCGRPPPDLGASVR